MFLTSELMLFFKMDLLTYLPFSVDVAVADARDIRSNIGVREISSTHDMGIDVWCTRLLDQAEEKKLAK
jgi:Ni2+-binding GTPase involved in maturation of urease and hydrogenase